MKEIFHHCECLGRDFTREEWGEPVASFGKFEFNMAATEAIGFDHDIDKLASRQSRGVIDGDGDDR